MHTPEKRRGGSHMLRAGVSQASRQQSHATGRASGSHHSNESTAAAANNRNSTMPALPPRAAMVSNSIGTSEDTHESSTNNGASVGGGASLAEKDNDSSGAAGSGPVRHGPKEKQKERERESALIREKDERITYLEKEMDIMEHEFQRELDKLSQNESETATFWQAKHSALNQQYLRTDTELRLLRAEVDVREAEREELRQGWEVLRQELKERDDDIRSLRSQIRGLKEFVSTSTRTDGQTSDEVFGDGMAKLGNGLQNWVITNFRRAKLVDLSKVDEGTLAELGELVPMYEDLVYGAKLHLLQSVVSKILVDMVFDAYFVGLSDSQTKHFRQMEGLLAAFASEESVNQWRASTLALVRRDAPQLLQDETGVCVEKVISRTNRILDTLTTDSSDPKASGSSRSEARDSALRVLVNNSIELARLLVAQKAVLKVQMPEVLPHQRVMFEPETMEDVGGEDEEALTRREICCVVFPGVIKHGDESGGQMQFRNVIAKARVLCSPED